MAQHDFQSSFSRIVPTGDDRERLVCDSCGHVQYENPKIVVGAVALWEGRILMARRAIPPRTGYWTLPAGYLEQGETAEAGAMREAWEETRARITLDGLIGLYSIPRISLIQLIYRARLNTPDVAPGPESLEVALYDWADIPWDEIAFPSVRWALNHAREIGDSAVFVPRGNPPGEWGDL